ncbi:hypothetical protein [Candidatus Enterococcus clewellii]|uniref:PTS cellobiose transporter subunit IIA n=1 Tax=Candidatus Enterococcus clewellii TaxID=1834193 RepID=A0A242KD75_9ENTE|nr:hypothetical protein [Enterococcus sp. 9E7_DIV0242]OTP19121.1 hypothetical protein A5888_000935 [Enterococcus sp. 9E7_DIV0242]
MKSTAIKSENIQQTKLRSIHFNRFLLFRYLTAIFFFINLYWSILSFSNLTMGIMMPLGLLLIDIAIIIEQTRKYWQPSSTLLVTKAGYAIQIFSNLLAMLMILFGYQQVLFPFLNSSGRGLLLLLLTIGSIVGGFVEWRIWQIEHNKDAYLKHMAVFEKSVRKEG